ncbi:hypothetical protein LSH36_705g01020 [Paralvinella palmiformis]|uniref:Mitochondrial inner membrane protein Mpv17 n=1 Tax=Paralvinella palmiformis TaxID=53620 RepID=A0AAD9J2W2_9ANNE|nr:hypothetical protein LSH36_705g01020 [Paralvinella palmiformis]
MLEQEVGSRVLMCLGDGLAQVFVEKKPLDKFDVKRSGRFFLYGTVILGPTLRSWYTILDKIVKGTGKSAALQKVALDQFGFAPGFLAFFLSSMTLFSTGSVTASIEKCKKDWKEVVVANWKIWPAAQTINFYFVPLNWRLIYVNVIAVFWNTYLAYISERDVHKR